MLSEILCTHILGTVLSQKCLWFMSGKRKFSRYPSKVIIRSCLVACVRLMAT